MTALAVATLLFALLWIAGSTRLPPVYTIESEIVLPADRERSWAVLTDFDRYGDWNPYMPRAAGEFKPGATLSFTILDDNFEKPLDLRATIGEISPPEQFYWQGRLLLQGVHDTKHGFTLEALESGATRLRHYEEFRGILTWLFASRSDRQDKTRDSHVRMNQALRDSLAD